MRVCLYGCVSGCKQGEQDTIAAQQQTLRAWAKEGGHEVEGEFRVENVSASIC